ANRPSIALFTPDNGVTRRRACVGPDIVWKSRAPNGSTCGPIHRERRSGTGTLAGLEPCLPGIAIGRISDQEAHVQAVTKGSERSRRIASVTQRAAGEER